jgi:hypothetical protein
MSTTTALLLLSAALIAAGFGLIWRDVHRGRREAFLVRGNRPAAASADPELEVTVAHRASEPPARRAASLSASLQASAPHPGSGLPSATDAAPQWGRLQPVLARAVQQVNAVLAAAGVEIGAAGEPSWSINRRYGVYRRILLRGESVAWLRIEVDAASQLQASVKAHKDDLAAINADAQATARGLSVAGASDLLSECLKPAASFAMLAAAGGGNTEQWASETGWKAVEPIVVAALKAANGALAQAGARFIPAGTPAWVPDVRRHRLIVTIEVLDAQAARMLIERIGEEIEVAVGVPGARLAHLARRQRLRVAGLTTHALAELIAGSAWPAIAHVREAS